MVSTHHDVLQRSKAPEINCNVMYGYYKKTLLLFHLFMNLKQHSNIKWKGKTYQQLIHRISKNTTPDNSLFTPNPMKAQSLKLYRKEIVTNPGHAISKYASIDSISYPGGSIPWGKYESSDDTTTTADNYLEHAYKEGVLYHDVEPTNCCYSKNNIQQNARNRVRSTGRMQSSYSSNTKQYLQKRQKTYAQNQFHFTRDDDNSLSAQIGDLTTCSLPNFTHAYYKPNNTSFSTEGAVDSSCFILKQSVCARNDCTTKTPMKHKMASPMNRTPFITKYTNRNCYIPSSSSSRTQEPLPGGR